MQRLTLLAVKGGILVNTNGQTSTTIVEGSFPGSTVSVFNTGTTNLATIYGDNLNPPTAKSNPFTADANGFAFFYAPNGSRVDVQLSGTGIASPFVVAGDVLFSDPAIISLAAPVIIPFSATPAFDLSLASWFQLMLTGNVTGPTFPNAAAGNLLVLSLIQDGTGGRTFAFPGSFLHPPTIDTTASSHTELTFKFDGTTWTQFAATADNTAVPGNLSVGGKTTVGGTLAVTGATALATLSTTGNATVGGSLLAKNFEGVRYADQFPGGDIGAKINAAIADLGSTGGIIMIPQGAYFFSTQINANNTSGVSIVGSGGQTGGAAASCFLTYTGTSIPITAQSSVGFKFSNIMLAWSNAGFTGPVIDTSHSAAANDTVYLEIDHCSFFKSGSGAAASVILSLDKTIDASVKYCAFHNAVVAIRGAVDNTSYSNANEIYHCEFSSGTGDISVSFIRNVCTGWRIVNNDFEMGQAVGTPAIMDFTAGAVSNAIGVEVSGGNWIGDNSANGTYTMFTVGTGWSITGNFINGGGTNTTIFSLANSSHGISIKGNEIATAGVAYAFGTGVLNVDATANNLLSVTSVFTGTPGLGCNITDALGNIVVCTGIPVVGNGIPVIVAKLDFAAQAANIGNNVIYAVPAAGAGFYRISAAIVLTQAATSSSTLPAADVVWVDKDTSVTEPQNTFSQTNTANTVGSTSGDPLNPVTIINVKASTNISVATSGYASSGVTVMQYAAHFRVEYLGA